jgi:hypothetical protein
MEMSMFTDEVMLELYSQAVGLPGIEPEFVVMLQNELSRRGLRVPGRLESGIK